MRVLLALDKFKHALDAPAACTAAASAIRGTGIEIDEAPLADGGDGFAAILTRAAGGKLLSHQVLGPRFEPVTARYGEVDLQKIPAAARAKLELPADGRLAILEMAQASGLHLLAVDARDPWHASSIGTGQLLARAADTHARAVLLGVGGSATNDLGLGALEAVGLEFRDASAGPLTRITPARFADILRLAGEPWPHLPELRIACDVTNPLVGPLGATATFGPQKGLLAEDFPRLERTIGNMAKKICAHFDQPRILMMEPGAGAAGGIAFGLRTACAARLVPGAALVADWLNLDERIRAADLVVTGEGRFDASSLAGKVPGLVAELALRHGKKLLVLAGSVDETAAHLLRARASAGQVIVLALSAPGEPPETAFPATADRLADKMKNAL